MEHSFHGRTYASMTATGQAKYQASFHPLVPGFSYAPFNDLEGVAAKVTDNTCAIFVEPIQGEGGVIPAGQDFLEGLRELCDRQGILLVYDEVQCGMGRTGHAFAWQHYGVKPDVVTMAKALGAGVPVGAVAACGECASILAPGDHAATFGGNFLAAAAADVMLERLEEGRLLAHVGEVSHRLSEALQALKSEFSCVKDVRGVGLMMGMELTVPVRPLIESCIRDGLLVVNAGPNILRFVPPLVISSQEIDAAVAIVRKALEKVEA
jgi:acetylornithine/succinyldiaminopimelate/putrescine aminotransferase